MSMPSIHGGIESYLSLLSSGVPICEDDGYTEIVLLSSRKGNSKQINSMIIDYPNLLNDNLSKNGITPLMVAVSSGNKEYVELFLNTNRCNINQSDNQGRTVLYYAIFHNQFELFEYLISFGCADIHVIDNQNRNLLHIASYTGNLRIINFILKKLSRNESTNLIFQKDEYGCTCLHYAVSRKYEEITEALLSFNSINDNDEEEEDEENNPIRQNLLDIKDNNGMTAFLYSCKQKESEEWVEYLLDEGCDFTCFDNYGHSALHYSVLQKNHNVIKTLLCFIIDLEDFDSLHFILNIRSVGGYTPLHYSIMTENIPLFKVLVSAYKKSLAGVSKQISLANLVDDRQRNIFHMAAFVNNVELCQLVFKFFPSICSLSDSYNRNALFYAINNIEYNNDIDLKNGKEYCESNNTNNSSILSPCIEFIIENENIDLYQLDKDQCNILHYACYNNQLSVIQYILSYINNNNNSLSSITFDTHDKNGNTPLHIAASRGYSECIRVLILMGSSKIDAFDNLNRTPLHIAIQNKHIECAEVLVQLGANINSIDNQLRTPLHYACIVDLQQSAISEYFVQILLQDSDKDSVIKSDIKGMSPLLISCATGNIRTIKELLHHLLRRISVGPGTNESILWPNSFIDKKKWNPMHYAAFYGYAEVLRLLLDYFRRENENSSKKIGTMIEWTDNNGMTPFHFACSHKSSSLCVKILIENYMNDNNNIITTDLFMKRDNFGRTGLHIAAGNNNLATCKILLNIKPNLANVCDNNGKKPIDYIKEDIIGSNELKECLKVIDTIDDDNTIKIQSNSNIINCPSKLPLPQQLSNNLNDSTKKSDDKKTKQTPKSTPRKLRKKSVSNITIRSRTPRPRHSIEDFDCLPKKIVTKESSNLATKKDIKCIPMPESSPKIHQVKIQKKKINASPSTSLDRKNLSSKIYSTPTSKSSSTNISKRVGTPYRCKTKKSVLMKTPNEKQTKISDSVIKPNTPINISSNSTKSKILPIDKENHSGSITKTPKKKSKTKSDTSDSIPQVKYSVKSHSSVFERLNAHAVARNEARKARELQTK